MIPSEMLYSQCRQRGNNVAFSDQLLRHKLDRCVHQSERSIEYFACALW